jgi:hypothetical protein
MKSTRLFKQAFILATVSSLALSSAIAMEKEKEKENSNHFTITQKLGGWNDAVKEKNLEKLQNLCKEGLQKTVTNDFEKLIWENRDERLTQALIPNINEGAEIDYSQLTDSFDEPTSLSNNTVPTVTNPQFLKEEDKTPEPYPQWVISSLDNKEENTTVNSSTTINNIYFMDSNTNVTTNTQVLQQELKIENKPQKTAKQLWDEINENTRTTRFNLVLSGLWGLYNNGLLKPVAENKEKGTFEVKSKKLTFSVNLNQVNKEVSKFIGKDQYMYKYTIEELDNVFNKKLGLSVENLIDPCSIGGKKFAKNYNISENYNFSKLYYYRENVFHVIPEVINSIKENNSELN